MNHQLLQSTRISLRAPELSDLDFMFHIENDTKLWFISANKVPYSRYQLQRYIRENNHDIYSDKQLRLMIEDNNNRQLVGIIDLFDYSPLHHRAEVGIVISADSRSKGYATEALELLCYYAETMLDIHQLYAYVYSNNQAACSLFKKNNFISIAELQDWGCNNGKYQNAIIFQRIFPKKTVNN